NLSLRNAVAATGSTTERISVMVSTLGDAVKVNGPKVLKIDPPSPGQPTQSAFEIEAVSEGLAQVAVIFRQGGNELANVKLKIQVKAGVLAGTRATASVVSAPPVAGTDGVLFLDVRKDTTGSDIRYHYDLSCVRLGWDHLGFDSPKLLARDGSAATSETAFVERIYDAMTNKMLRTQSQVAQFALEVEAFGEDLCAQLFPPDMIRALWDARSQIDSIRVMSWEAYIPWELVKLALPGPQKQSDTKFLSQYGMVRWLAGLSAPRRLPLKDWTYYAATYPNNPADDVTKEVAYLTTGLSKYHITPTHVASTYDAFAGAWQDGEFDVFHVACHGDVKDDNIEKAELVITDELVNGRPQLISISANVVGKIARLWPRRPLVFLNACEAGRLGESLTAWGGWPQKLIASGAGVVVGASWPVRDVASNKFAEAFYDALLAGEPLSAAAAAARTAAATSGDATWVSFKVFGDPHARLEQ
ncbi:MAG TPA: CHAT domain-containing protein, partial [Vicinamibacterales bacterium]